MTATTAATISNKELAEDLLDQARAEAVNASAPSEVWTVLHQRLLRPAMPFEVHQEAYQLCYEGVEDVKPCWMPPSSPASSDTTEQQTNIHKMMATQGFTTYQELYDWSIAKTTKNDFWMQSMQRLGIVWDEPPTMAFGGPDAAHVTYFPDATLNIADSCFHHRHPDEPALVYAMESNPRHLQHMSFGVLHKLSNQIASALVEKLQLQPGDTVGICMPMTPESIAIYLGIVKAGCAVVSIADSFSAAEIAMRCRLGQAKAIVTQDVIYRGQGKVLPLHARVLEASRLVQEGNGCHDDDDETKETKSDHDSDTGPLMKVVVLPGMLHAGPYPEVKDMKRSESGTWNDKDPEGNPVPLHDSIHLRPGLDCSWHDFLSGCTDEFVSIKRSSMDACNILFSSGTTGDPKAIVWSHSTPIKGAIDGMYHQDIQVGDRVAWPTNIGWMMGPWLLFQMINGATIGIFNGVTSTDAFCQFVEEAKISMVGVIPSLVKAWQARNATANCDWSCVRRFSSTGEASDPDNYLWLMSRVPGYAPVMEYCGGTEIGGSYLSSTMVQPNVPSMFSTPVLGSQILLLDTSDESLSSSKPMKSSAFRVETANSTISGEVALVPPALGLSTHLLNRNHFDTYYKGMPSGPIHGEILRRHGDEIQMVRNSSYLGDGEHDTSPYFRALGRCDDTMNIGGIKVSSVEIERVCNLVHGVQETAAIGVSSGPNGGPSNLVIYVVLQQANGESTTNVAELKAAMKSSIKANLNPLFGISDVVVATSLPRTASNKVMRRLLRDEYVKNHQK